LVILFHFHFTSPSKQINDKAFPYAANKKVLKVVNIKHLKRIQGKKKHALKTGQFFTSSTNYSVYEMTERSGQF